MNSRFNSAVVGMVSLLCFAGVSSARWRVEAESKEVARQSSISAVDDAGASGGRALRVSSEISEQPLIQLGFPQQCRPGRYRVILRLRTQGLLDIGKGLRVEVREDGRLIEYDVIYGYKLKGAEGYQEFSLQCLYLNNTPEISVHWSGEHGEPTIYLDAIDFDRLDNAPPILLKRLWPDRIRYQPHQSGEIAVTLESVSSQSETARLQIELGYGLGEKRSLGERTVQLQRGATLEVNFPLTNLGDKWGYEIRAVLHQDGQVIGETSEFFTVHDEIWAIGQSGGFDVERPAPDIYWHHAITMGGGSTDDEIRECVEVMRRQKGYCTKVELGRMPEELLYMAPQGPVWFDNQAGWVTCKRETQLAVKTLHTQGLGATLYLSPFAWGGPYLMSLIREKPEWLVYWGAATPEEMRNVMDDYNRNIHRKRAGDIHVNYNSAKMERLERFWRSFEDSGFFGYRDPDSPGWQGTEADWDQYKDYWAKVKTEVAKLGKQTDKASIAPNTKLPEVVDHIADQIIASVEMFGWDGIRWDGRMGVFTADFAWPYVPYYDFWGNPLNTTEEAAVEETLVMLRRLKQRVAEKYPNLIWGYNYGSWVELHRNPRLTEEMCRDGGMMVNEFPQWYNRNEAPWDDTRHESEPYSLWKNFYTVSSDEANLITSLGGHYLPYIGGWKYPPDNLYGGIMSLATKGHLTTGAGYWNSCFPTGNINQFAIRFGQFVYDNKLVRLNDPHKRVAVTVASSVWWEKSVYELHSLQEDYLVLHLINPPVAREVETDPSCSFPDPVSDVVVEVKLPEGRKEASAWALMSESWTWGDEAKTQAVSLDVILAEGKASVRVPQILLWKMVVFKFQ